MKKYTYLLCLICLSFISFAEAQHKLILQHQKKPNKQKALLLHKTWWIKTSNNKVLDCKILGIKNDSLVVRLSHEFDSTYMLAIQDITLISGQYATNAREFWAEYWRDLGAGAKMLGLIFGIPIVVASAMDLQNLKIILFTTAGLGTLSVAIAGVEYAFWKRYDLQHKWKITGLE